MNWGRVLFETDLFTGVSRRTGSFRRGPRWRGPMYYSQARWRRHLLMLTSQVNAIVRCNAPLSAGLERAVADGPPLKLAQALIALRDDLASGCSLAEAMDRRPRSYPRWYVDIVRAGETTGSLSAALKSAGDHLARSMEFGWSFRGWVGYLSLIVSMQIGIGLFLSVYVVPEFDAVFKDFGTTPPRMMQYLLNVSQHMRTIHLRYITVAFAIFAAYRTSRMLIGQRSFDWAHLARRILAPIPFLGQPAVKLELARVCAVLERLVAARVPLNEALYDCALLDIHPSVSAALHRARMRVENGQSLGDSLRDENLFPVSFVTLLSLGDASEHLPEAAAQLRVIYELQVATICRITIDLIGPLCVIALGTLTFFIYGGIFSTIIGLIDELYQQTF